MPQEGCPPVEQIRRFFTGDLPDAVFDAVESHLNDGCPHCNQTLADLEGTPDAFHLLHRYCGSSLSGSTLKRADAGTATAIIHHTPPQLPPDRYELLRELGRGGMGVVYLARQVKANRFVALKTLSAGRSTAPEERARFRIEAEAVAHLHHPNIVQLYEVDEHEGMPFFLLEYVEGGNLADRLKGGPLPARESAVLMEKVARAMDHAHKRGVIHRDLKPRNVLLTPDGQPKVSDFGLAKRLDGDAGQTQSGAVMGTPAYMAPEQAEGRTRDIGSHTDVHALGVILYECLTGVTPFQDESFLSLLEKVRTQEPAPPSRRNSSVPRDLETICLKCLRKEPSQRYGSAGELADDLGRFLAGEPIQARPQSSAERVWRWAKRRPAVAALLVAVIGTVLTGLGVSLYFFAMARDQALLAQRHVYLSNMKQVQHAWEVNRYMQVRTLLNFDQSPEGGVPDFRGFEWHYWRRHFQAQRDVFGDHLRGVRCVAFSPDQRWIASASSDATVRIWDIKSGQIHQALGPHGQAAIAVAFSPNGRQLVSVNTFPADKVRVRVWDTAEWRVIREQELADGTPSAIAFSPEGRYLAWGTSAGKIWVLDAGTGREFLPAWKGHANHVFSLAFTRKGKQFLTCDNKTICIWELATGREIQKIEAGDEKLVGAAFSIDGRSVFATRNRDGAIEVWDAATGRHSRTLGEGGDEAQWGPVLSPDGKQIAVTHREGTFRILELPEDGDPAPARVFRGHTGTVNCVAYSPDGRALASAGTDRTLILWDMKAPSPAPDRLQLPGEANRVHGLAWAPDGQRLATGSQDGLVRVWNLEDGQLLKTLEGHTQHVQSLDISPDGKFIASVGKDATVRVWDVDAGKEVRTLTDHTAWGFGVAFSPDGKRIASCGVDRTVRLWNAATGVCERELLGHTNRVLNVAFRRDGMQVASAGHDATVRVWDVNTGRQAMVIETGGGEVYAVAYSPDGKWLVSGGNDTFLRVWDARTGALQREFSGHTDDIWGLDFSPDGKRLASASWDRTVKVWDTQTWQETLSLEGEPSRGNVVRFSPDGHRLAAGFWESTVRIWDARPLDR